METAWQAVQHDVGVSTPFAAYFREIGRPFRDILGRLGLSDEADEIERVFRATALREAPRVPAFPGIHTALARLDKRDAAHRNAEEALQLNGDPATRYQVAGVYALTSKDHPEDRKEAFRLLASALKKDYGFEYLDEDPELAPVRDLAEFKQLVAAARALKSTGPK